MFHRCLGAELHWMQWARFGPFLMISWIILISLVCVCILKYTCRKNLFLVQIQPWIVQLPFSESISVNSNTKWSFQYLFLWSLFDRVLCLLHLSGWSPLSTKQAQNGIALSLGAVSSLCSSVPRAVIRCQTCAHSREIVSHQASRACKEFCLSYWEQMLACHHWRTAPK